MKYFFTNKKTKIHLIFLSIISLYYLVPYLLVGQLMLDPNDILDNEIVFNNVIGKIYNGNFESVDAFLAGEIKWFFLRRVLQPLTILYAFFSSETAFWITDILVRLIAYILFFKLSKKLNCSTFNSALISCFFASTIITHFGIGVACMPYLIYLLINNKNLKLKHYSIIALIGLNTDLAYDLFIIPLVYFISLIFISGFQKYNYKKFFKIALTLLLFILLSNSNLIYSQLFFGPFHRVEWILETRSMSDNINELVSRFFSLPKFKNNPYFFNSLPSNIFIFLITLVGFFSKNKKAYAVLLIIFFILLVNFLLNLEFISQARINSSGIFKTINWNNVEYALPVMYALLFVTLNNLIILKKLKYLIYPIVVFSIFTLQLKNSIVPIGKHLLSFENLSEQNKNRLRESFHKQKYDILIKDIVKFNKNNKNNLNADFKSKYTFKGYYDYKNYKYIKSLVGNNRTVSINLDPMVAVMNNIKVIDGYHNLYPLSYKAKFRKVIQKQLEHYEEMRKYYDNWGSKVYTFVSDPNIIKINFAEAKLLGAEYVISKYPISNQILELVCSNCNNSTNLFLYKITN